MPLTDGSFKHKKVISIGTVSELTGLTERQIRYYESRKLIFPERSKTGLRKFSFQDIETLIEIANRLEDGVWTNEIRKELKGREQFIAEAKLSNHLINGKINAQLKL